MSPCPPWPHPARAAKVATRDGAPRPRRWWRRAPLVPARGPWPAQVTVWKIPDELIVTHYGALPWHEYLVRLQRSLSYRSVVRRRVTGDGTWIAAFEWTPDARREWTTWLARRRVAAKKKCRKKK